MPYPPGSAVLRLFLAASMLCVAMLAGSRAAWAGIGDGFTRGPFTVVEFYNVHLDHYFLTMDGAEMADIEAGRAGPGWVRTGYGFKAYAGAGTRSDSPCFEVDCGAPVSRFYAPSPNSHFYSGFPDEVAFLVRTGTGWLLERMEFTLPLPDTAGRCAAGLQPVFRLYNNRWMFNDTNHRFVADVQARQQMLSRGWIDEGVAFCTPGAVDVALKSLLLDAGRERKIRPSAQCEDESLNIGPCMALNNLPVPGTRWGSIPPPPPPSTEGGLPPPSDFSVRTGIDLGAENIYYVGGDPAPAGNAFVQLLDASMGIHVDTRNRGSADLSSVNPLYQLRTSVAPGARDERFFPWAGPSEGEVQLAVSFRLNVKRLEVRAAGGAAFGHPTLEFIDQRSGKHLYFTALAYGTVGQTDYLAPDLATGIVIVGTILRPGNPLLRNLGVRSVGIASGFVAAEPHGVGGDFEFRMDRAEFQRVLERARSVDAALSPSPDDYLLDNFHFNNEVFRDGEIGLNIADYRLELRRR